MQRLSSAERFGHDFLRALYHLIHTARIYQDHHQLTRKSVRSFQALLEEMTEERDLSLVLWRGRFHLGGEKLPFRRETSGIVNGMADFFTRRGMMNLNFSRSACQAPPGDMLTFVPSAERFCQA